MNHLIVDDCNINRLVIRTLLKRGKFTTHEATNGLDVIKLIKEDNKYDIIWIDVKMPKMDGIECTKTLREDYKYDGTIIGITGQVDIDTINNCKDVGMNDIIPKPVTFDKIMEIANKYK